MLTGETIMSDDGHHEGANKVLMMIKMMSNTRTGRAHRDALSGRSWENDEYALAAPDMVHKTAESHHGVADRSCNTCTK